MPVNVPENPKVLTTTYQSFRGVDYTNDPTNVWYRRSPSGKNMLPDLDGRPRKRTGWEIELTPAHFREAAGISGDVEVIQDRVYYFELGGYDYLMIFNNLGVFSYYENPMGGASSQAFPKLLVHHNEYIDLNGATQSFPPSGYGEIDPRRGFFFEGGGTSGFYLFVGIKLFRYDGAYFTEVAPHVPVVLIGCDPSGAGTQLEAVNILTRERYVQYTCDGETTSFTVPLGFTGTPVVEVLDSSGEWVAATGYTAADGRIDFDTAPQVVAQGADNMRVKYVPAGAGAEATENEVIRGEKTIKITRTVVQTRTKAKKNGTPTAWKTTSTTYATEGNVFDIAGVKTNATNKTRVCTVECRDNTDSNWVSMNADYFTEEFTAYENSLKVTPKNAIYSSSVPTSNSTSKTTPKAWTTKKVTNKKTKKVTTTYTQTRTTVTTKEYLVRVRYTQYTYNEGSNVVNEAVTAFSQCSKNLVFGSGIINQVFVTATPYVNYNTRVWYSVATDPSYFPDTNYIEVGATDKPIMGLLKVGEYLGIVKKGTATGTSIYLAYPTSFEDETTYAVKQNVNGIGAISCGAFNSLNEEPLFLSSDGVMGIEVSEDDTDRQIKNRSYYINKPLCAEDCVSQAISFVYEGMYFLCVNGHCYVLDGSQKNSWENTKTNLQYEAYYLDNIPAQCFCKFKGDLLFTDFRGNLCRFMKESEEKPYHDAYSVSEPVWTAQNAPQDGVYAISDLSGDNEEVNVSDTILCGSDWYTVTEVGDTSVTVGNGVPIDAVWSTIADDDGSAQYFKTMQKKGCIVSLFPSSDSGVDVYVKADDNDPIYVGSTDAKDYTLPYDYYIKKKVKRYKRLQIICENNVLDDSFGVDQIIKSYTVGNYAKG